MERISSRFGNTEYMSFRLAKNPIPVPAKVQVSADNGTLLVKGSKETLSRSIHSSVAIDVTNEGVVIKPKNNSRLAHALTGTFAAHIVAMMQGVETPFKKVLILNGVGYKVELRGKELVFALGFSHPVVMQIPDGITVTVVKNTITIEGADKQQVGQFAAEVRDKKRPEPYLGKGIKYETEVIRRKQGKKAV